MSGITERLKVALADRYRLERELGAGGMATVYLAQDLKHNRQVAIKVLKPELAAVLGADRFVQEIQTTAALQHPHILPLFDSGSADEFLYYVMPYVEGETLRDTLNRETQLGIEEAVKITTEVADALDYAHRHGVIHRDIKPENILLHDGRPMVADFGIALALSAAAGGRMTETGMSLGTPHYMSPEQATADKDITGRSDIYSLASVLYEMLTGEPPHMGNSAQQIIMKIIAEPVQLVTKLRKNVPPNVTAALSKALEKLPADRFDNAKGFAEALANPAFTAATAGISAGATTLPRYRLTALTASLAATTLLFAAIATWALLRPPLTPVIRYGLAFPADRALVAGAGPQFAFAPDGSWLVYTGPGSSPGETQLWVKARDQLEATPLAGTSGAVSPSVSPDGHWIGFHASGSLRRVAASGGVPSTIADTVWPGVGGVWLDAGTVAYTDAQARLRRVPAVGGASEVVVTPEAGRGAVPVAALPDGRGILFLNCSAGCGTSEIWVADSRSGEAKRLLPDVGWAAYADGRLLFVRRDGGVFAVPFDLGSLSMEGAPVALFDGVRVDAGAHITLAASGTLAYLAGAGSGGLSEAVWVSRDGRAVPVDTGWAFQLGSGGWSLSPDGTRLAIALSTGNSDIWIKELDRGPVSRLTFSDSVDMRPRWTPDGRAVTFLSNRAGSFDLYQRRADGTGTDSLLLDLEAPIWEALWSRDRQWIVMRTGTGANQRDIVALRVGRDTVPRPLLTAPYDEAVPALSPDGRWLAYESGETGRREIFVRPFPDVESGKWQISTAGGTSPVWAHSGRELFFINGNRELVSQSVLPDAAFQRGEQQVLFSIAGYEVGGNYTNFDVSPDDRRFLMIRPKASTAAEAPVLIVVENWLEEVKRLMKSGSR